jgi:hypothetical protein
MTFLVSSLNGGTSTPLKLYRSDINWLHGRMLLYENRAIDNQRLSDRRIDDVEC